MQLTIYFVLLIFPTLIYSKHVVSPENPQTHKQTPLPAATLARRDSIPTLTFGPASNYANLSPNAPTLTGLDLSIVKRSEATGGVDVFLGPDRQKTVQSIIENKCPNDPSSQCIQDMAQAFDQKEVGIQARQVGIFIVSAAVLAFAFWLQHTLDSNAQSHDHAFLPETDVSQAASMVSSSTLVFFTTTQDPHPITFTSTDNADSTTSGLVVSTATAQGDGYDEGDVVIQVPASLGNRIGYFVGMASPCAKKQFDQTDLDCIDQVAENLMVQASQRGPFRDLVLVTTTLPGLKDDLGTHLANLVKTATQHITGLSLSDDGVKFLAEIAFWIVYEQLIKNTMIADQIVIPAASTVSAAPAATSSSSCPPEDRKPNCSNCGSTQKNEDKSSGFCPGPKWAGCPCVDGPAFPYDPLDADTFAKAQAALKSIPTIDKEPEEIMVQCADGNRPVVFSNNVKYNIDSFCSKYDGQEVGDVTNQEWYDNGDGNWINFWVSKDQATCGNDKQKVNKDACSKAMNVAFQKCAAVTTTTGATIGGYLCMDYGFYGADAATAGKPVQCPDPNPLLNFAQNPCDTKCNGAGWERCSPDLEAPNDTLEDHAGPLRNYPFIKFSCYCKNTPTLDSPCAGMKCGDPIKMQDGPVKDGISRYGLFRVPGTGCLTLPYPAPPSMFACDVGCPNGNYNCGDGTERWNNHSACRCTDQPCKMQVCIDAIRDYGVPGR